jgi:hypothetical protein
VDVWIGRSAWCEPRDSGSGEPRGEDSTGYTAGDVPLERRRLASTHQDDHQTIVSQDFRYDRFGAVAIASVGVIRIKWNP